MLLGVKEKLRLKLRENGHRVRVYVPFGRQWYPYSIRRLKENPAIAGYVLKTMFSRDSVN
jgi:proline dehydrogenase